MLRPLWQDYPGKRDGLAEAIGSTGSTLSAVNTGRQRLGLNLGQRIADALGVTIFDLGAPSNVQVAAQAAKVLDRLGAIESRQADVLQELAEIRELVAVLPRGQDDEA